MKYEFELDPRTGRIFRLDRRSEGLTGTEKQRGEGTSAYSPLLYFADV